MQDERPISFESRRIKGKYLHKAIYEKEKLAILHAHKKGRPYLMGRHFKVKSDHDSLKYFLEQRLSSEEQQNSVTKMLGYDFEIDDSNVETCSEHNCAITPFCSFF